MNTDPLDSLTQVAAARLLGVTTKSLREWSDAPRNADGTYDGPALVHWRIQVLTAADGHVSQRERLAAAQADKVERENAVAIRELAPVATLVRVLELSNSIVRNRFLGMPHALAAILAAESRTPEVAEIMHTWIHDALTELADGAEFETAAVAEGLVADPAHDPA